MLKPEDIRVLIPIPTPRPERANRGSSTSSMYLAQIFFSVQNCKKSPPISHQIENSCSPAKIIAEVADSKCEEWHWEKSISVYHKKWLNSPVEGACVVFSHFQRSFPTWAENLSPGHRRFACIRVPLNTKKQLFCPILMQELFTWFGWEAAMYSASALEMNLRP